MVSTVVLQVVLDEMGSVSDIKQWGEGLVDAIFHIDIERHSPD
jgi:hypothetical protein